MTPGRKARPRRQQQIDTKTESNTKYCGCLGTTRCEAAASIEPQGNREKPFSAPARLGFYASTHDKK
jgi:hypothetical protein